jgi:hypothetical protein
MAPPAAIAAIQPRTFRRGVLLSANRIRRIPDPNRATLEVTLKT